MKFRTHVEPPEPMKGLEVPQEVAEALDGGKRPTADFARALDADPLARAACNRLPYGLKLQHVRAIESAKKPETRRRRIDKAIAVLRGPGSNGGHDASDRTSP